MIWLFGPREREYDRAGDISKRCAARLRKHLHCIEEFPADQRAVLHFIDAIA